jgi:hypothetical protein
MELERGWCFGFWGGIANRSLGPMYGLCDSGMQNFRCKAERVTEKASRLQCGMAEGKVDWRLFDWRDKAGGPDRGPALR